MHGKENPALFSENGVIHHPSSLAQHRSKKKRKQINNIIVKMKNR
jgi:hypothetical protein